MRFFSGMTDHQLRPQSHVWMLYRGRFHLGWLLTLNCILIFKITIQNMRWTRYESIFQKITLKSD
ncbi:TPA: hypothetical protein MIP52_23265 [Klebsiella pneumoniae]|nr:hypothetical protein B9051_009375 [Klebsiella pneumoniae]HBX5234393.1 hypothetical protein [Klebsiella pneumoniae]HBY0986387.1 hypothetical protein [Klebsiella pneumoniae]HBY1078716.1 hypothetical protein [Klebsiella pneumoniae]